MQIGDVYHIYVKLLLKANANFGNFCFNHDLNKETIIYNCTGNKDEIFIDNNSFHSRNRLSNVPDTKFCGESEFI